MGIFTKRNEEIKDVLDLSKDYFTRDYTKLKSSPENMKIEKERDIERYKETHVLINPNENLSEEKYTLIFGDYKGTWENILLGFSNVFVNKFYEPFRFFDTQKDKDEIESMMDENGTSEAEILVFLKKNRFVYFRFFLDEFEEIQQSNHDGKIVAKQDKDGIAKIIWVKNADKANACHPYRIEIPLHLFSCKTLKYAIEKITEEKKAKSNQKTDKTKVKVYKEKL